MTQTRPKPRIYPKGLQVEVDLTDLPKPLDKIVWLHQMLDNDDKGDLPPRLMRLAVRRKNEPYPEHSLGQLRDDPVDNPY